MRKNVLAIFIIVIIAIVVFIVASKIYKSGNDIAQKTIPNHELFIRDHSPTLGPMMARITIVEFLDPECESCRAMHPVIKGILKEYEGKIRYVVRYMPFHTNSSTAIKWLEATRKQDKYWNTLDVLFENQPVWGDHHNPRPDLVPGYIRSVGVDFEKAKKDIDDPKIQEMISSDREDGQKLGVTGTPTIFINGKILMELGYEPLKRMIEKELK